MNRLIQLRKITSLFVILLAFVWLGLLPKAQAVSPAPDGGYPGGNTAEGQNALQNLTTGGYNTAVGFLSLDANTVGSFNTAIGAGTLLANTADENTAVGVAALLSNTTGSTNTAYGAFALFGNTTGQINTALGFEALQSNTTGIRNCAAGNQTLYSLTTGDSNTAFGNFALANTQTGSFNTGLGRRALTNNGGSLNVGLGYYAGHSLTTGDNNIIIDTLGATSESNTIRIGCQVPEVLNPDGTMRPAHTATYIAGISGATVSGTAVVVDTNGRLGVAPSSRRFKAEIKPMDDASEAILALMPVTFRYKEEIDSQGIRQFGLIAEDVEKVSPDFVTRDAEGKVYTVRYDAINAMLLNEFLKEHRKVEQQGRKVEEQETTILQLKSTVAKQEATAAQQQKEIKALTASLKEQASQIQKVSARLEVSKPAQQTVLNNQ